MRRAPIVIAATVLGTGGVLLFKPLATTSVVASGSTERLSSTGSGSGSTPSSSSSGATSSSTTAPPSPSASSSASSGTSALTTTVTGAVETDRYGDTRVEVIIKAGKITDVEVLEYNDDDPRSAQISQAAIPVLRQEVLAKQTAAVDAVSGATYTSNAYEASLQAALDEAGFTAADGSKADTDLSTADAGIQGR